MSDLVSGTSRATDAILELVDLTRNHGAWINPNVKIDVAETDVCFRARHFFERRQSIIRVPIELMPRLNDFELETHANEFVIANQDPRATSIQGEIMSLMIEAYNRTEKLNAWRKASPWYTLSDHNEILDHLLRGRGMSPKAQRFSRLKADGNHSALLKESFIGARAFNLKEPVLSNDTRAVGQDREQVLLPLIDFFNHDMRAEGYNVQAEPAPASMRVFGSPNPETLELFVRYNQYDPVDTYLFYGFVDEAAPYLASVPLVLECSGSELSVTATGASAKGKLAPAIKDLRSFLPIISRNAKGISMSKLIIPGSGAPRALRRILVISIGQLGLRGKDLQHEVLRTEEKVIEHNLEYWGKMKSLAHRLPEQHGINLLCHKALSVLGHYRDTVMAKEL